MTDGDEEAGPTSLKASALYLFEKRPADIQDEEAQSEAAAVVIQRQYRAIRSRSMLDEFPPSSESPKDEPAPEVPQAAPAPEVPQAAPAPEVPRKAAFRAIELMDEAAIFEAAAERFEFEVSFEDGQWELAAPSVGIESGYGAAVMQQLAEEARERLTAVDLASVDLAVQEAVALRRWATGTAPEVFRGNLRLFLLDERVMGTRVPEDTDCSKISFEAGQLLDRARRRPWLGSEVYGGASARASILAMQQRLELETVFARAVDRCCALGIAQVPPEAASVTGSRPAPPKPTPTPTVAEQRGQKPRSNERRVCFVQLPSLRGDVAVLDEDGNMDLDEGVAGSSGFERPLPPPGAGSGRLEVALDYADRGRFAEKLQQLKGLVVASGAAFNSRYVALVDARGRSFRPMEGRAGGGPPPNPHMSSLEHHRFPMVMRYRPADVAQGEALWDPGSVEPAESPLTAVSYMESRSESWKGAADNMIRMLESRGVRRGQVLSIDAYSHGGDGIFCTFYSSELPDGGALGLRYQQDSSSKYARTEFFRKAKAKGRNKQLVSMTGCSGPDGEVLYCFYHSGGEGLKELEIAECCSRSWDEAAKGVIQALGDAGARAGQVLRIDAYGEGSPDGSVVFFAIYSRHLPDLGPLSIEYQTHEGADSIAELGSRAAHHVEDLGVPRSHLLGITFGLQLDRHVVYVFWHSAKGVRPPDGLGGAVPAALELPSPRPGMFRFKDPRPPGIGDVGIVAFYYPGKEEAWDRLCCSSFLGNFFHVGLRGVELEAPCNPGRVHAFANAEAAFQALKFWNRAGEFATVSGQEAFQKKKQLSGQEDFSYAGFGSNWTGMLAVLRGKFRPGTLLSLALIKTGDAFLLEHNAATGRDRVWSDNGNGDGLNWLGLQLLLIRDELSGQERWTRFIKGLIYTESGKARTPADALRWQDIVWSATAALLTELGTAAWVPKAAPTCRRQGCGEPMLKGMPSGYCSQSCRDTTDNGGGGARPAVVTPPKSPEPVASGPDTDAAPIAPAPDPFLDPFFGEADRAATPKPRWGWSTRDLESAAVERRLHEASVNKPARHGPVWDREASGSSTGLRRRDCAGRADNCGVKKCPVQ